MSIISEKLEKVIKGLECCAVSKLHDRCSQCPYFSSCGTEYGSFAEVAHDALELLKAQEPRVLTLAEVLESEVLYAEDIDKKDVIPVLFNARWGDQIVLIKPHLYGGRSHKFSVLICDYGKRWRCWSKKPTDKQRLEVEWE